MTTPANSSARGETTRAVLRAVRVLGIGCTLAVVALVFARLVRSLGYMLGSDIGLGLLLAHTTLLLAALVGWAASRRLLALSGVLLVSGWALLLPSWRELPMGAMWAPGYTILPFAGWAAAILRRPLNQLVGWLLGGVLAGVDLMVKLLDGWPHDGADILTSLWFIIPAAPIILLVDGVRVVAEHVEGQIVERQHIARTVDEHRSDALARAESARLLHDHVLHALHAIAHVGGRVVTPEMASAECRSALHELARPRSTELRASVRELLAGDLLVGRMAVDLRGDTGPMPADVAEAMAAAAHAALDNARQHSGTRDVEVRLEREGEVHRVVVVDRGVGFRPDKVPLARMGLRCSIRERMEDVGGQAAVDSAPGRGTRVVLSWPRSDAGDGTSAQAQGAQWMLRRRLVRTAWPGMAVSAAAIALMGPSAGGWRAVLLVAAALAVGLWASWSFVVGSLNRRRAVIALLASVLSWGGALWWALDGPTVNQPHHLWPFWAAVALMHLAVLSVTPRTGLLVVPAWTLLSIGMADAALPALDPRLLLLLGAIALGDGWVTVGSLVLFERLAARQDEEWRGAASARLASARVRHASNVQEYWSDQVTGEAIPLMQAVAEGGTVSPGQIDHATLLEATLRDELLLGPDQTRILAVLNVLRRRGWHINTPSVTSAERRFLDGMAYWISLIGEPAHFKQEVLVTMSRGQAVLVVLQPSAEQLALWQSTAERMSADLDHDETFARLRMALPEVPGSTFPASD